MTDERHRNECIHLLAGADPDPTVDCGELVRYAIDQGIAGILLACSGVSHSPALRAALAEAARADAALDLIITTETRRVIDLLSGAGIDLLILKGVALGHWLYRESWQRPKVDLDLLVADSVAAQRAVVLLERLGFSPFAGVPISKSDGYEIALQRPGGITIDLHWRLINHAALGSCLTFSILRDRAIQLPALHRHARGLCKEHALYHALLHRITNIAKGAGGRLIWLWDIHLLASSLTSADWRDFLRIALTTRTSALCLDGLISSRDSFRTPIPDEVTAVLLDSSAPGDLGLGSFTSQGAADRAHVAALPWRQKLAWARRKLIPPAQFMRLRYNAHSKWELLRAYLKRWWLGIRRALGGR